MSNIQKAVKFLFDELDDVAARRLLAELIKTFDSEQQTALLIEFAHVLNEVRSAGRFHLLGEKDTKEERTRVLKTWRAFDRDCGEKNNGFFNVAEIRPQLEAFISTGRGRITCQELAQKVFDLDLVKGRRYNSERFFGVLARLRSRLAVFFLDNPTVRPVIDIKNDRENLYIWVAPE